MKLILTFSGDDPTLLEAWLEKAIAARLIVVDKERPAIKNLHHDVYGLTFGIQLKP